MKCFYHYEREAVVQCQHCGKFLCTECASHYIPCMCDECAIQVHNDAVYNLRDDVKSLKKKFIMLSVVGVVCAIIMEKFTLAVASGPNADNAINYIVGKAW